jgi:hypothetical protein
LNGGHQLKLRCEQGIQPIWLNPLVPEAEKSNPPVVPLCQRGTIQEGKRILLFDYEFPSLAKRGRGDFPDCAIDRILSRLSAGGHHRARMGAGFV